MSESIPEKKSESVESAEPTGRKISRRRMLTVLGIGINAIAGGLFAIPIIGYILAPASRRQIEKGLDWVTLGDLEKFPVGETRFATYRNPTSVPWDGDTANVACWVRRISADQWQVFAVNCAHLGCPVRWFPQSGLFMCPCHGGIYYADGARASGPPPRGLYTYDYKMEGGELWIKAGEMPTLSDMPSVAALGEKQRSNMRLIERLKRVGAWFDARLQIGKPMMEAATHKVPRRSASWAYVFGSASLTVLILQVVTGICLALVYVPSAEGAWSSLQHLNQVQTFGWFIRALHGWGSNFMVALVLVHMCQVFLFGAFKYPRELTWMVGVLLLVLTLGMAFTGEVMRFDQDAYWGLGIGAAMMGRVPFIGDQLVKLMLGGPIIAGETLSRFFALHVFVIPGLLLAFVGVHLLMVLKLGINEWPVPGRLVKRDTYLKEYHEETQKDGVPFIPDAFRKDLVFSGIVILALVLCAAFVGPIGPNGPPDPTVVQTSPVPDFFFLWMFAALALLPPNMETFLMLVGPVVALGALFALPLLSGTGEKSWRRRPVAVLSMLIIIVALAATTRLGMYAPWSPVMDAWSSDPVPQEFLTGRSPLERQGAVVLQAKQCRNCHSLGGVGGLRGPALDSVATRLTEDQLFRQVLQGGGNMPAYGNNLSPAETTALVSFLKTLHPANESRARDAALVNHATPATPGR